jgi:hypothetical protein
MKKFLLPALLGGLAAFLNWSAVNSQLNPPRTELTRVLRSMKVGETFQDADLQSIIFVGDVGSLKSSAIPFEEKSVLSGRVVPRDLAKGDLVLWRDATPPPSVLKVEPGEKILPVSLAGVNVEPKLLGVGLQIGFLISGPTQAVVPGGARRAATPAADDTLYVGPFRLLSIGSRLSADEIPRGGQGDERLVTVAIRLDSAGRPAGPAQQLVHAIDRGQNQGRRIVAIVLDPPGEVASPRVARASDAPGEVPVGADASRTGPPIRR